LHRKVVSLLLLLCLLVVLPAAAVAQSDPPVVNDAAVVDGFLTASVTTNGLEARARAELLNSDGTWRVLSVHVIQGSAVRIELPPLTAGEQVRLVVFTTAGQATSPVITIGAPPTPAPTATPAPTPAPTPTPGAVEGKTVAVEVLSGEVSYRVPPATTYRELTGTATLPMGVLLETTDGTVGLTAEADGQPQSGTFFGGKFTVNQNAAGMTELALAGPLSCTAKDRATAAQKGKKKKRSLWGKDSGGKFRTRGNGSVATVRGTEWRTTDTCAGTEIYVREGSVRVWPRRGGRSKLIRAGQRQFTPRPR
jgi:hypothetical protein